MTEEVIIEKSPLPGEFSDVPPSVIRTGVPIIVSLFSMFGLDQIVMNSALQSAAAAIVAIIYYFVVRILETKVNPNWGLFLGSRKAPAYSGEQTVITKKVVAPAVTPQDAPPIPDPPTDLISEPAPAKVSTESEFPEEFLWMLQEGRLDPIENAAIGADDAEWLAQQKE